jgi:dihydrofolate synthase/folylpolyglutamate synthase
LNYPDSVEFLYALGNEIKTAKLGLDRIARLLSALGDPHRAGRFIHVAGTNGKGSTCAMIEAGLRASGMRTGLFTSPHLHEPTERIRLDGQPVARERFTQAFERVHEAAEELLDCDAIDLHPTYFEMVAAMGFLVFAEEKVDCCVLEVGLGGRLDATNVVQPDLCVITPIDFDHEAFLGKSLQAIAAEKAGILKPGVAAVLAAQRPEAAETLTARARELDVEIIQPAEAEDLEIYAHGSAFTVSGMRVECRLAGIHQVGNALTALAALQQLGVPPYAIQSGIAAARWPGRLETVSRQPEVLLDGAHNPAGARALAAHLEKFYADRPITLIYGAMRDKAVAEMAGILFPAAARVIVTAPKQPRAVQPATVRDAVDYPDVQIAPDIAAALALAHAQTGAGPIVVTGSLYLVAEARELMLLST